MPAIKLNDQEKSDIKEMIAHLQQAIDDLKLCIKGNSCMMERLDLALDEASEAVRWEKIRALKFDTFNPANGKRLAVPVDAELVKDAIVTPEPKPRLRLAHLP